MTGVLREQEKKDSGDKRGVRQEGHHTYVAGDQISEFAMAAFDFWQVHQCKRPTTQPTNERGEHNKESKQNNNVCQLKRTPASTNAPVYTYVTVDDVEEQKQKLLKLLFIKSTRLIITKEQAVLSPGKRYKEAVILFPILKPKINA